MPVVEILISAFVDDNRIILVPTRRVGMQLQRAALRNRPQRGLNEFPRSAWELDKYRP